MATFDTDTSPEHERNPELIKAIGEFSKQMLTKLETKFGAFSYKIEGETTKKMPSAIKDGSFVGYPEGAFKIPTKKHEINDFQDPTQEEAGDEKNDHETEKKTFHNLNHTKKIMLRIEVMCDAINKHAEASGHPEIAISPNIKNALILAASAHDIEQKFHINDMKDGKSGNLRIYHNGENEIDSVAILMEIAEKKIKINSQGTSEAEEILSILRDSILETRRHINDGPDTVQQQFDSSKPWPTHLLAFADIGGAGMNPETYITEGDAFLLELFPFVLDNFSKYSEGEKIPDKMKKEVELLIRLWDKGQISWVKGRENKFNNAWTDAKTDPPTEFPADIDMVPEEVRVAIRPLFANFAESARLAEDRQKKRANMTFEELAENFGFIKH